MTKKKFILTLLAFLLALPLLNQPFEKLFPTVKATYVDGDITVDTVWTLAESPFIVVQNITVHRGVTLTIEPGVEVRFGGGPFTIIVNGTLKAVGTEEKPIKFTSNKENPKAGDWATICFNGAGQTPSVMENCIVEYGLDGLTIKDGALTVLKSIVQFNALSGITVLGGASNITKTVVRSGRDGVVVLSGNAYIRDNNVSLNENGVALKLNHHGSRVTVTQNRIFSNKIGVSLSMNVSGDVSITNNLVFSNVKGFLVSTNVTTVITHNYIYNNEVGAYYELGNHSVRFNDIYQNKIGVDASPKAKVNATQNYWGDPTGPYHESLNPSGKGNPVGGNGVNVDFIFFLTASIDHENSPPKAVLWADKTKVAPGQEVTFVGSYSEDDGRVDKYLFDFGDGSKSNWTTVSIFFHKYSNVGTYNASLTVMDDFEAVNTSLPLEIQVADLPSLNVELSLGSREIHRNGEISITVRVSNGSGPVEGANVVLYAIKDGSFSQQAGLTGPSGFFTTTFKAPDVMDIKYIRIIAKASMEGYADGSAFDYLKVIPPLNVEVTASPQQVVSEEPSTIEVRVMWNGVPVANTTVKVSSSTGGVFKETEKLTDLNGEATFIFTAPPVTNETTIVVIAHAFREGYLDGEGQTVLLVFPKVLSLMVLTQQCVAFSEEEVKVVVNARYGNSPVENVNITLSADAGECSPTTAFTDTGGNTTFIFKAPPVPAETNVTLRAVASKPGYATSTSQMVLAIKPGNLTVMVAPSSYWVESGEMVKITVHVKCGGRLIENASVTVSAEMGTFSETQALTNSSGCCEFSFRAPRVSEATSIKLTVNAEKYGYTGSSQSISLTVLAPSEGGISWLVILLILIPVVLVVVFAVLVKVGVILVTFGEGEEE